MKDYDMEVLIKISNVHGITQVLLYAEYTDELSMYRSWESQTSGN